MKRSAQIWKLLPLAAALAGLSACSTAPTAPAASAATPSAFGASAKALTEREVITGSRIPSKSTDRLIKTIDASGAKEMERERIPNSGPKFN